MKIWCKNMRNRPWWISSLNWVLVLKSMEQDHQCPTMQLTCKTSRHVITLSILRQMVPFSHMQSQSYISEHGGTRYSQPRGFNTLIWIFYQGYLETQDLTKENRWCLMMSVLSPPRCIWVYCHLAITCIWTKIMGIGCSIITLQVSPRNRFSHGINCKCIMFHLTYLLVLP